MNFTGTTGSVTSLSRLRRARGFSRGRGAAVVILLFAAGSVWGHAGESEARPPASGSGEVSPAALVQRLASDDYDARQEAVRALEKLGEKARGALREALKKSGDLETQNIAAKLLQRLNKASLELDVYDRAGQPVKGAQAALTIQNVGNPFQRNQKQKKLSTGKDGKALQKGFKPGLLTLYLNWTNVTLVPGSFPSRHLYLRRGLNRLQATVIRSGRVKGRVRAAGKEGKPLEGANVSLLADRGQDVKAEELDANLVNPFNRSRRKKASSDAQGAFSVEKVPPGRYFVIVQQADYRAVCAGAVEVREDAESSLAQTVRLAPAPKPGKIKIQLLTPDGKPLKKSKLFVEIQRQPDPGQEDAARRAMMRRLRYGGFGVAGMGFGGFGGFGGQKPQQVETGEKGFVELAERKPGTYRVTVHPKDAAPLVIKKVKIAAGETTALQSRKLRPGGAIRGRVLASNPVLVRRVSVWAVAMDAPETEILLHGISRYRNWFQRRRYRFGGQSQGFAATGNEGRFTLKHLAPGRYLLYVALPGGGLGLVFGVEVAEGRTTRAPELYLPGQAGRTAKSGALMSVKGVVLLPDGQPAARASVTLKYGNGSWGTQAGSNGRFSFIARGRSGWSNPPRQDQVESLRVKLAGYRPRLVDLTKKGLDLENLSVRLKRQVYGRLRVTVTDPQGKPLPGARVMPVPASRTYAYSQVFGRYQHKASRAVVVNRKGQALLKGLAWGKREIKVQLDGYYLLRDPLKVDVKPDAEVALKIVLRPGLVWKGEVRLPEGLDARKVLVHLVEEKKVNSPQRTAGVDSKGRFQFTGLRPGRYRLWAQAPGWIAAETSPLELTEGAKPVRLRLARPGGIKLELGHAARGAPLQLVAPGSWNPIRQAAAKKSARALYTPYRHAYLPVNSLGQAEYHGLHPGTYDLLFTPRQDPFRGGGGHKEVPAAIVFPGVKVSVWPGGPAGLEKAEPLRLKMPATAGNVKGRIRLKIHLDKRRYGTNAGSLTLTFVGERAVATVRYGVPYELDNKRPPIVVGTPPKGFAPPTPPGGFSVKGLPEGTYRLYLKVQPNLRRYYRNGRWIKPDDEKEKKAPPEIPQPFRTIHVKDGRTVDLGEIPYEIPAEVLKKMRAYASSIQNPNFSEIGEDETPVFHP